MEADQFEGEFQRPEKRSKGDEPSLEIVTTTTVAVDPSGMSPARAHISVHRKRSLLRRSFSEPRDIGMTTPSAPIPQIRRQQSQFTSTTLTPDRHFARSVADLRSPAVASMVSSWTSGTSIDRRAHFFSQKMTFLGKNCDVCAKSFGFGATALSCAGIGASTLNCADCGLTCHEHCRDRAPIPCVPRQGTPKTPGNQRPRLLDFCPNRPPLIPHIVIHCVVELERRGLGFVGIYRIPGSERQVADLLHKFKTMRGVPNLYDTDIAAITGCIKKFLQELRDPLIPSTSWREFVDAAEQKSEDKLYHAIADLPMPNRDTLAYLCAHWQRVAEMSEENKMPLTNLARVLGPTVVGYSEDGTSYVNMAQAADEIRKQSMVMMALLSMPHEYWLRYYTFEDLLTITDNDNWITITYTTPSNSLNVTVASDLIEDEHFVADHQLIQ